jgi:hypothetical protein
MNIPLIGLIHTMSVVRASTESDDGAGGVNLGDVSVYTGVNCRVSVLSAEDKQFKSGTDGKKLWKVLSEYKPNIQFNDIIIPSGRGLSGRFRVLKVAHQQDDVGNYHHTSLTVEAE